MFGKTFFDTNVQNIKNILTNRSSYGIIIDRIIVGLVYQRGSFNGMGKMYLSDLRCGCGKV